MSRVALDAMGGDHAPEAAVEGALLAARGGVEVTLAGDEARLRAALARAGGAPPGLEVAHAPEAVAMGERAAARGALRRRETSIAVGLSLVRDGACDAFVSAGDTGAIHAAAFVLLGRLPGVERPAAGVVIPAPAGEFLLLDAGANAEARPAHLLQWARLGDSYMRAVRGLAEPRVALLNIGEEASKGTPAAVEAHALLAASGLRFAGNVEGRDLTANRADVVVTDGFTGNVALKLAEGVSGMLFAELRAAAERSWRARLGGWLLRPAARGLRDRLDYRTHGAAPLLGVGGAVFIAHGASDATAIANAIRRGAEAAAAGMVAALRAAAAAAQPPGAPPAAPPEEDADAGAAAPE